MMEVARQGHEVVALANLLPVEESTDDLDSWMYQTVGHQAVAALSACTGLPMFRRRISGTSKAQALTYQAAAGDEVEDLYALLAYCREKIPGLQAVCSGAIASDYQRTRVESVCSRLGMVSLAPLWRRPQGPLLDAMVTGGVDAIIAKVAAAGLRPDRDLGAPLAALVPRLHALRARYGCNVCGEGGEYETLTLDCPAFAAGKIVLDGWDVVPRDNDALAPVALLRPTAFHVEPKAAAAGGGGAAGALSRVEEVPATWQPPAAALAARDAVLTAALEDGRVAAALDAGASGSGNRSLEITTSVRCTPAGYYSISAEAVPAAPGPHAESTCLAACLFAVHRELEGILGQQDDVQNATAAAPHRSTESIVASAGDALKSALFVHLFIPDMVHFAAANAVYGAFLPETDPPARATVQAAGGRLVIEVLGHQPRISGSAGTNSTTPCASSRKGLHVQSISSWAPACIGPYAQAVAHAGVLRCAGQIGLDPASMAVVNGGLVPQTTACLHHCASVGVACASDLPKAMLSAAVFLADAADGKEPGAAGSRPSDREASPAAHAVHDMVSRFLREGSVDGGAETSDDAANALNAHEDSDAEEEEEPELDTYLRPPSQAHRRWQPLLSYIQLPQLPRGVLVEVQPCSLTADALTEATFDDSSSSSSSSDDDGNGDAAAWRPRSWVKSLVRVGGDVGGGVHAERLVSTGHFLHAQLWIPAGSTAGGEALAAAAERVLADASLAPEDVVTVRAYAAGGELAISRDLRVLGQPVAVIAVLAIAIAGDGVAPALCPADALLDIWVTGLVL